MLLTSTTLDPAADKVRDAAPYAGRVSIQIPGPSERWRCGGCGNLTRFDVTRARRTTEFWHFDLAGDHEVEETQVREETVEQVSCRWCGRDDAIELVGRADIADGGASESAQ